MSTTDLLVYLAPGAVKAVPAGDHLTRVEGLCVVFDDDGAGRDLSGERFTSSTFFGPSIRAGKATVVEATYHHGIATRPELKGLAAHDFSHGVTVTKTDAGLLASLILDERDTYEKAVADAARAGKLGWSTGSAPHRVVKSEDGKIERWPLVEVAILPAPCEPRTYAAVAAKSVSLSTLIASGSDAPGGTKAATDGDGESLTARIERVAQAVRGLVTHPNGHAWPVEVYDRAVVVESYAPPLDGLDTRGPGGSRVVRIPYTDDGERVTLAPSTDWQPVERRVSYDALKALTDLRDDLASTKAAAELRAAFSL